MNFVIEQLVNKTVFENLLKDKKQLLSAAQEKTKALRQMCFESISEIDKHSIFILF